MEDTNLSTGSERNPKPGASDQTKTSDTENVEPSYTSTREQELVMPEGNSSVTDPGLPAAPKGKKDNKQSRRRGYYHGSRRECYQAIDPNLEPESGSIFERGSRKHNWTHLLDYAYDPEPSTSSNYNTQRKYISTKSLISTRAHKFKTEQYLLANCQFVVRADGDYNRSLEDPDQLIDWSLIELIRTHNCEPVVCPICLSFPTVGKMTRCGHIYCWTCILQLITFSDKTGRMCPICNEVVLIKDLKSVDCIHKTSYGLGSVITLQLMKRKKGSSIVSSVIQFDERMKNTILNLSEKKLDTHFSKLLLAQPSDVDQIIKEEYMQLQSRLADYTDSPEYRFIEEALKLLDERKRLLNAPKDEIKKKISHGISTSTPRTDYHGLENPKTNHQQEYYYFYQSRDGQHIYLHSMNFHMIEANYSCVEECPNLIQGRIIEKETGSITDELRNRLHYLQHLPVTCHFEVVEIEMSVPLVSEETLKVFESRIEARKRKRLMAAKAEQMREEEIAKTKGRISPSTQWHPSGQLHLHLPDSDDQRVEPCDLSYSSETNVSEISFPPLSTSSLPFASLSLGQPAPSHPDQPRISFAQVLKKGKPNSSGIRAEPDTSSSQQQRQQCVTISSDLEDVNAAVLTPTPPPNSSVPDSSVKEEPDSMH